MHPSQKYILSIALKECLLEYYFSVKATNAMNAFGYEKAFDNQISLFRPCMNPFMEIAGG